MTETPTAPRWRRSACSVALAVFTVVLITAATLMLFSRFMLYDDEGYVLFSLKNFAEHGALYREVYSQYGPLPYVFYYALTLLGAPINHLTGRVVTMAAWSGAALLSGAIVWRVTRSYAGVAATLAAEFVYLWVMVSEPSHPGGLIVALTAALAAVGTRLPSNGSARGMAAFAGAIVSALVLTKINVGAFAAISAGAFLLLNHTHPLAQRWSPWIVVAGFVALPFALMRPLLHAPWVQTYAAVYALAAASTAGAAALSRAALVTSREVRAFIAGGAVILVIIAAVVLARGSTAGDLLQGIALGPMRHPVSFSLVFKWPPGAMGFAAVSSAVFGWCCWLRRTPSAVRADTAVAVGRLLASFGLAVTLCRFPAISADNLVLGFGASCLWLFAWPLERRPGSNAPRVWISLVLLGQFLHPFPVPGSQIAWGTFLVIPLAVSGAWEAAGWLRGRLAWQSLRGPTASLLPRLLLGSLAGYLAWQLAEIGRQYFDGRTLALAGAEQIRLPDQSTARYQILSVNALAHADVLFSLPGMFSFNLWTGLPAPTLANVTHWFSLLSGAQQQAIIHRLEEQKRAVVIVETGHVDFLRQRGLAPAGPLYDYIEREFVPAFALDGFEFRVHRGRQIAPYFVAEAFSRPDAAEIPKDRTEPDPSHTRLVVPLLLPADQAIASLEIISINGRTAPLVLGPADVRLELTPITSAGRPGGPTVAATLPLALKNSANVAFYFDGRRHRFDLVDTLIVLRDAAGAELGLVRLRP